MKHAAIIALIDQFLSHGDVSKKLAWQIEGALSEIETAAPVVESVLEVIASYQPGGGEFLYDEQELRPRLQALRRYLEEDRSA